MNFTNVFLALSLVFAFPAIFLSGLRNPALGLGVLFFFLPVLNLSFRLFNSPPYPSLETIAVILLWIATLMHTVRQRKNGRFKHKYSIPFLIYVAVLFFLATSFISSFYAVDSNLALKIWLTGAVSPLLCYFIAIRYIHSMDDVKYLLFGLFGLVVQVTIFTALAFKVRQGLVSSDDLVSYLYTQSNSVVLFGGASATVSVIIMAIPLAAWYRVHGKWHPNLVGITVFILVWGVAALSLSKGSWLGLVIATAISIPMVLKRAQIELFLTLAGVLFLSYYTGFWGLINSFVDFKLNLPDLNFNIHTRLINFQLAFQSIPTHIFFGYGLGNYPQIYKEFPTALASNSIPLWFAHNLILTLIPEIGFIGTLSFVILIFLSINQGLKIAKSFMYGRDRQFIFAVIIGLISYLVIASTAGTHLIAVLTNNLCAPALIVLFSYLGGVTTFTGKMVNQK